MIISTFPSISWKALALFSLQCYHHSAKYDNQHKMIFPLMPSEITALDNTARTASPHLLTTTFAWISYNQTYNNCHASINAKSARNMDNTAHSFQACTQPLLLIHHPPIHPLFSINQPSTHPSSITTAFSRTIQCTSTSEKWHWTRQRQRVSHVPNYATRLCRSDMPRRRAS